MIISHKKMIDIKNKINELYIDNENNEILYNYIKDILKYDETYKVQYNKENYEKYMKKYNEKNKEKINIQKAKSAKKRYYEKKNEIENKKIEN
jgi:hypothetical protein